MPNAKITCYFGISDRINHLHGGSLFALTEAFKTSK